MKISAIRVIGLSGLVVAVATFIHQPVMQSEVRSATSETIAQKISDPSSNISPFSNTANTHLSASTATQASSISANVLAIGTFVGDSHPTSGNARIVEENGQRYLELDESFKSDAGPDLFVLLHEEAVPESYSDSNYVNLGRVQRTVGAQRYAIPADVDLEAFQSAVIWCREFGVTFGYATL